MYGVVSCFFLQPCLLHLMLYRVPNVNFSALDIWIHWALSQLCSVVASFLTFPAYDLTREIEYILVSKKQFEDAEPRGIETQVLAVDGSPQASLTPSMIFVEAEFACSKRSSKRRPIRMLNTGSLLCDPVHLVLTRLPFRLSLFGQK